MQIIIAGQPQLGEKLARGELIQLRQRISILSRLEALHAEDVRTYISHRLKVAGYRGLELFTPEAMALIATHSQGIPRNVNTICFNALSLGCALERELISDDIIREVIADLNPDYMSSTQSETIACNQSAKQKASSPTQASRGNPAWHDPALGLIVEQARESTGATGAAIALTDQGQMTCRARVGETAPGLGAILDTNSGLTGECVRSGEVVRCDDSLTDSRVDADVCRQLGIRSLIAIPLHRNKAPVGVLQVSSTRPHAFTDRDTLTLRAAADQILKMTFNHAHETTRCFSVRNTGRRRLLTRLLPTSLIRREGG
jgi:hypothetical protein